MKLTKDGIIRNEDGDLILQRWPWKRPKKHMNFWSDKWALHFDSMKSYWKFVGACSYEPFEQLLEQDSERIKGYNRIDVLSTWAFLRYPGENFVVLDNVDVSAKGISFWLKLSPEKIGSLMKDIVVIRCDTKADVKTVVEAVPTSFAEAYGFITGKLSYTNTEL